MADFNIKKGDTLPALRAILADADGVPVDVTGSTIIFNMIDRDSRDVKVARRAVTILDGPAGSVSMPWIAGDTDTSGEYYGEFEVTYPGGGVESFPNDSSIDIHIEADLG